MIALSLLWRAGFLLAVFGLICLITYEILVLWPGIESASPALEGGFSTTGPPAMSLKLFLIGSQFCCYCLLFLYCSLFGCWTFELIVLFKLSISVLLSEAVSILSFIPSLKFLNFIILLISKGSFILFECLFFIICFCFLGAYFLLTSWGC